MEQETNKAIVRRLYEETFNHDGDLGVVDEFIAADFVDHAAPPGLPPGREGFKLAAGVWRGAFPDLRLSVDAVVAEGDLVALAWTGTGTHGGELMGIPPTGQGGRTSGITVNRMADGRIAERWGNSDDLGLLQQLGVIPGAAPAESSMEPAAIRSENGASARAATTTPEENKALVRRMYATLDSGDLAAVPEVFDAVWVNHDPSFPPLRGHEGAGLLIGMLKGAFPDFRTTIESLIAEGDLVAAHVTHRATHGGEFMGIPATGRQATVTATGIFRVAGGRLVENNVIFDALGLLRQIGVVPEPAPA